MFNGKEKDIGKMFKRKKFMRLIFNGISKDEHIRVYQSKKYINEETEEEVDYKNINYFNDIDDLNNFTETKKYNINTYFNLTTTDGQGGKEANLKYRYCLAWDFDKKDDPNLDAKSVMFKFKELNLWYHAIISSGNGFHVYMVIDRTDDLQKVEDVTKAMGSILKADPNAMLKTQILRIPLTFNIKDKKSKQVNIIHMFEENIKPYNLDELYARFCNKKQTDDRTIQYALNKSDFPPCIVNMLKGVEDGDRNFAMRRIISFLNQYKHPRSEGYNIIKEWNMKNNPPMSNNEFEYQFKQIWEKYDYLGCIAKDEGTQAIINKYCDRDTCKSKSKDDILFIEGETIIMEYKLCKDLRRSKKDKFQLNGSHLLLISILKNNNGTLYSNQLIQHLTYKGESCLGATKISQFINELNDNGYITITKGNKRKGEKDLYTLHDIRKNDMTQYHLSYFAVLGVIKKNITPEDFKIYCFLRYRLSNGLSCTQEVIADELAISQPNVCYHINNLLKEKYVEVIVKYIGGHPVNFYRTNV